MNEPSPHEQYLASVANKARHPKDWALKLAERTDTFIPGNIKEAMWSLPIIERLVERVERLERMLENRNVP